MNPTQVTQDGDSRHIFSMKGEDAVGVRIHVCLLFCELNRPMMFVLPIICSGDLGQQPSDHFDNVGDGHGTDFI